MHLHGSRLKPRRHCLRFAQKTFTLHPCRAISYTFQNLAPRTGTLSSPFPESVFQQFEQPCRDQRPRQSGALTELPPVASYEPKQHAENQDHRHITEDKQFTEHEDLRIKPLFFHQSIIASTYDSAESIATPPESDSDDEQLRALLTSPLYLQKEGASAERSQVYHSERENLMSSSSQDPISTGKPVAVFSDREDFPSRHQQFFGSNEPFLDSLTR